MTSICLISEKWKNTVQSRTVYQDSLFPEIHMPTIPLLIESPAALGTAIRARRKALGLRIDDAAALVGLSVDVLSRMETGKGVRLDSVLKVLDGLGLVLLLARKDGAVVDEARRASDAEPSAR